MAPRIDRDEAFTAFVGTAAPQLVRAAWRVTGDRGLAADVLQAALVRTYVAWPRLRPGSAGDHVEDGLRRLAGSRPVTRDEPPDVPLDLAAVLDGGREALRNRRLGWTVAGLATLSVVAALLVTYLLPPLALGWGP